MKKREVTEVRGSTVKLWEMLHEQARSGGGGLVKIL